MQKRCGASHQPLSPPDQRPPDKTATGGTRCPPTCVCVTARTTVAQPRAVHVAPRLPPQAAVAQASDSVQPSGSVRASGSVQHLAGRAREGNDVADVAHRSRVEHQPLEADAEAGVRLRAEAARVEVGRVVLLLEPELGHARQQHLEPLLALRATHHLADAREEHIHRAHRLVVVVEAHVERLAALGVVVHDDGLLVDRLGEVLLVLCLQLVAPLGHVLPRDAVLGARHLGDDVYGLGVRDAHKLVVRDHLEALAELLLAVLDALLGLALLLEVLEEGEVLAVRLEHVPEAVAQVRLRAIHVVLQVAEGDLGLDHPKLGEVTRRVGVFGAERRPKRVDRAKGAGIVLAVELTGDGEVGLLAEEVLRIVDRPRRLGRYCHVERRHLEHLAGALAIGARDERRMHVHEAARLEEGVGRVGERVADTHHRTHHAGARPHVRDAAERLEIDLGRRDRVLGAVARADDLDGLHRKLPLLALRGRDLEAALDAHRAAVARALGSLPRVRWQLILFEHELQRRLTRAVVDRDEAELLLRAVGADPAADRHALAL
mmetsp:Transcript_66685/g.182899  ORF Transcript_66685/g.182899 Transcript_66685/m.182899 type:complete len:547 (+) Transcript_66685:440-2080(+)